MNNPRTTIVDRLVALRARQTAIQCELTIVAPGLAPLYQRVYDDIQRDIIKYEEVLEIIDAPHYKQSAGTTP